MNTSNTDYEIITMKRETEIPDRNSFKTVYDALIEGEKPDNKWI